MELMEVPELQSFMAVKDNEPDGMRDPMSIITVAGFQRYCMLIEQHIKMTNADSAGSASR
jgi:hypothetical protein